MSDAPRSRMIARLTTQCAAPDRRARVPTRADQATLGALMWAACRPTDGSIADDEVETLAQACAEIGKVFDGVHGAFMAEASELVFRDGTAVNATLIIWRWDAPFVAHSFTAPDWRKRGLAGAGIQRSMNHLLAHGHSSLGLDVPLANAPACRLVARLGFVKWAARDLP